MTGSRQNDKRTADRPRELAAHLRRLVSEIPPVLDRDPQEALHRAREAAKWILQNLFRQAYSGTTGEPPEELRYGALYSLVVSADLLPRRIQVQFQAIETFGHDDVRLVDL